MFRAMTLVGPQRACVPVNRTPLLGTMGIVRSEATLITTDGERIFATHFPADSGSKDLCFVFVHGFTQTHRTPNAVRITGELCRSGAVIGIDMRGHGRSSGISVLAKDEVQDVDAAVAWARRLGYRSVVPVGFSLGGAVVIRHASEGRQPVEASVSVSAPAFWGYRGTPVMRRVHQGYVTRMGRAVIRTSRRTRVATPASWPQPWPDSPSQAAAKARDPLLIVHGDRDHYFPLEHPYAIHRSAADAGRSVELWIEPSMGHAESATAGPLVERIAAWAGTMTSVVTTEAAGTDLAGRTLDQM
jgi:pimeloyl-ACP methyl ester carboxylesterase